MSDSNVKSKKYNDTVSIIVPVYNAEKTLEMCISSLLKQSYKNLQLILINDGSKDRSLTICNSYAEKDDRVLVVDKENGGVSSARNEGIKRADGKWIFFCDSDDWMPIDGLKHLVNLANIRDYDMVCANATSICPGRYDQLLGHYLEEDLEVKPQERADHVARIFGNPFSKLFKTEIILHNAIRFDEDIKYGEDALFFYQYLKYAKDMYISSESVYNYVLLFDSNANGKYFPDINIWELKKLEAYISIFENEEIDPEIFSYQILDSFFVCCEKYAHYLSVDELKEKICETVGLFREYLGFINPNIDYTGIRGYWNEYSKCIEPYLESSDFYRMAINLADNKRAQIEESKKARLLKKLKRYFIFRAKIYTPHLK